MTLTARQLFGILGFLSVLLLATSIALFNEYLSNSYMQVWINGNQSLLVAYIAATIIVAFILGLACLRIGERFIVKAS